jgi:hypothetical protein
VHVSLDEESGNLWVELTYFGYEDTREWELSREAPSAGSRCGVVAGTFFFSKSLIDLMKTLLVSTISMMEFLPYALTKG